MGERHVVPNHGPEGGWKVIGSSTGATELHTASQREAIAAAEEELHGRGGEILIHNVHGEVQDKRTVSAAR